MRVRIPGLFMIFVEYEIERTLIYLEYHHWDILLLQRQARFD